MKNELKVTIIIHSKFITLRLLYCMLNIEHTIVIQSKTDMLLEKIKKKYFIKAVTNTDEIL